MCNLNILLKKDTNQKLIKPEHVERFLYLVADSYASNRDSEGMFIVEPNTWLMRKAEYKVAWHKDFDRMLRANALINHTRISTSGKTFDNCQPFIDEKQDWVFMHNGVLTLSLPDTKGASDSKIYYDKLLEYLDEMAPEDAITKMHKEHVTSGSFSLYLYNVRTHESYYWKNSSTSMYMVENDDIAVLSTNNARDDFFTERAGFEKETPSSLDIHKFWYKDDGKLTVDTVGKVEHTTRYASTYYGNGYDTYNNYNGYNNYGGKITGPRSKGITKHTQVHGQIRVTKDFQNFKLTVEPTSTTYGFRSFFDFTSIVVEMDMLNDCIDEMTSFKCVDIGEIIVEVAVKSEDGHIVYYQHDISKNKFTEKSVALRENTGKQAAKHQRNLNNMQFATRWGLTAMECDAICDGIAEVAEQLFMEILYEDNKNGKTVESFK